MQTGTSGHYIGRDGIPTDLVFLETLAGAGVRLEGLCAGMFPYLALDSMNYEFNAVRDHILAALRLHEDDVACLAALNANKSIEAHHGLYAEYRSLFLGSLADFGQTKSVREDALKSSQFTELADAVAVLISLCNKVNAYGYEQVKYVLISNSISNRSAGLALHVDRAMRFYRLLTRTSDTLFQRVQMRPLLSVPPLGIT